jgi:hypothetical protein
LLKNFADYIVYSLLTPKPGSQAGESLNLEKHAGSFGTVAVSID